MKIRSIKFYIKEGFGNLVKNRLMSVASIVTVMVSIFMVISSYCISVNISYMLKQVEDSIGISAFVQEDLELEKMTELLKEIEEIEHVVQVKYISPDDGLEIMKEELGDNSDILDAYKNDNPLSASFSVMVDSAENQDYVVMRLEQMQGIRKVKHALSLTNILINVGNAVRIIGMFIIIALSVISVVIIMNTIKLAVYIRKTEIGIMKFVGATDWFIRWPFVIEGMLIGFIGSVIPAGFTMIGYNAIINKIFEVFPIIKQLIEFKPSGEIFVNVFPIAIIVGVFIGTFGSVASVRKYLKV